MEWISVEDQLPEYGQYVFCWMGNYFQQMQYDVCCFEKAEIAGNNKLPYKWSTFGPMTYFGQDCTHWMKLPEPPTGYTVNKRVHY